MNNINNNKKATLGKINHANNSKLKLILFAVASFINPRYSTLIESM